MSEDPRHSTERVADWVAAAHLHDMPEGVRHQALRSFVNIIGCTVGGAHHDIVDVLKQELAPFAGVPTSTVFGRDRKTDMLQATLINCVSSGVYTFDDTHAEAVVHPSGPVASALLALAEARPCSGADLLLAFILGVEIICRLGKAIAVPPAIGNMSWLQTVITAPIAVALAAGKLMGLDRQRLLWAVGIAAAQSFGLRNASGSMWARILPGEAAQLGLKAALLAEHGITSGERAIEGKHGFASVFSQQPNFAALDQDLGQRFEILSNTFKPYPCGIVINPIIDVCLEVYAAKRFSPDQIQAIRLRVNPLAVTLTDRPRPHDTLQAQISLQHWAAVALVDGAAGLAQLDTRRIRDPAIAELRDKIETTGDSSLPTSSAEVLVTLKDGAIHTAMVKDCLGSPGHPMSDEDLNQKFRALALQSMPVEQIEGLLEKCWQLVQLDDVAVIASTSRVAQRSATRAVPREA